MFSRKHKCIYIHIPKTAGTSIEYKLGHFKKLERGVQDHRTIVEMEPVAIFEMFKLIKKGKISLPYNYLKKMIKGQIPISKRQYKNYFKFTFVRNPWSRVFSWYKNVMRDDRHKMRFGISDNCVFKDFLRNNLDQFELKTQLYWITNGIGEIPMDFIGRFENLAEDFSHVANALRLKDKTLPVLLAGDGRNYTQFYDNEMKNIVYEKYKDEIAIFKFKFGE